MKYIVYSKDLADPFYTIAELCQLFDLEKKQLHAYSDQFQVVPVLWNKQYGFLRDDARNLHNLIYKEENYGDKPSAKNDGPWA